MDFFADVFSKYWFVFVLMVLVGGVPATGRRTGYVGLVARFVILSAATFILIGVIGLLIR